MDSNLSRGWRYVKRQTISRLPRAFYVRNRSSAISIPENPSNSNHHTQRSSANNANHATGNETSAAHSTAHRRSFLLNRPVADDEQLLHSATWSPGVQSIASGVAGHIGRSQLSATSTPPDQYSPAINGNIASTSFATNSSAFPAFTDVPSQSNRFLKRSDRRIVNNFGYAPQSNQSPPSNDRARSSQITCSDHCDRWLYAGLLLCGVGFLFPYNSLVLASDFFLRKFPHSMIVFDLSLVYILSAFAAVCVCSLYVRWPPATTRTRTGALISLCTLLIFTVFQVQYPLDVSNQSIDLDSPTAINFTDEIEQQDSSIEMHNVTIVGASQDLHDHLSNVKIVHNMPHIVRLPIHSDLHLNQSDSNHHLLRHHHSNNHRTNMTHSPIVYSVNEYQLSLVSASLLAIGCTLQQSSLYGIAAQLPPRYTHALMTGESAAGLIAAALRMASRSASESLQANSTLFFFTSCVLIALCLLVQMRIQSTRAYAQHVLESEAAANTRSTLANQLINPNYGQHFGLDVSETPDDAFVAKSDSTEFDLPFGIDEEELRIRLANGWNKGPAAELGIQTLRRLSTGGRKREESNDMSDVLNLRTNDVCIDNSDAAVGQDVTEDHAEDEEDAEEDGENELFRLAGTIVNKRQLSRSIYKSTKARSAMPNEFDLEEDELVFDIDSTGLNRDLFEPNRLVSTIGTEPVAKYAQAANRSLDRAPEVCVSILNRDRSINHDGCGGWCRDYNSWWINRLPDTVHRLLHTSNKRMRLIQQLWPHLLSIWLAYAVTLSLFPGIESEIIDCRWRQWTAVLLIGTFNVCDLIGKLLAGLCLKAKSNHIFYAALSRLLLIPLLVICAGHRDPGSFGALLRPFAPAFSAILGLTNGLVGSLPMILAPGKVSLHHRHLTGVLMTFGYLFGLTAGSVFAYVLRAWFVPPLQQKDIEMLCN